MPSTGLVSLDQLLGSDGYPDKSAILVVGPPEIGKEAIGYWFTRSGLEQKDFCLHVTRLPTREVLQDVNTLACASYAVSNSVWLQAATGAAGGYFLWSAVLPRILGAAALLIGARRSRDMVLRESVKWLGLGLLSVCVGLVLVGNIESMLNLSNYYTTYSYGAIPWEAVFFILGYALYRSARSLAPLNRLPALESAITTSKESVG